MRTAVQRSTPSRRASRRVRWRLSSSLRSSRRGSSSPAARDVVVPPLVARSLEPEHRGRLGESVAASAPQHLRAAPRSRLARDWSVTARPRRWSTKDSASGSPAASGSQRAEGRSAPNLLPRSNGLDTFPPSNAANACSGPFPAAKTAQTLPRLRLSYRSQIRKSTCRRCAWVAARAGGYASGRLRLQTKGAEFNPQWSFVFFGSDVDPRGAGPSEKMLAPNTIAIDDAALIAAWPRCRTDFTPSTPPTHQSITSVTLETTRPDARPRRS